MIATKKCKTHRGSLKSKEFLWTISKTFINVNYNQSQSQLYFLFSLFLHLTSSFFLNSLAYAKSKVIQQKRILGGKCTWSEKRISAEKLLMLEWVICKRTDSSPWICKRDVMALREGESGDPIFSRLHPTLLKRQLIKTMWIVDEPNKKTVVT